MVEGTLEMREDLRGLEEEQRAIRWLASSSSFMQSLQIGLPVGIAPLLVLNLDAPFSRPSQPKRRFILKFAINDVV